DPQARVRLAFLRRVERRRLRRARRWRCCRPHHEGPCRAGRYAHGCGRSPLGITRTAPRRTATSRRARGRDGGVREELAAGVVQWTPKTEVEATSILPSLNGKTARPWRGTLPFKRLAREGRMTVTIGRRELLAALLLRTLLGARRLSCHR